MCRKSFLYCCGHAPAATSTLRVGFPLKVGITLSEICRGGARDTSFLLTTRAIAGTLGPVIKPLRMHLFCKLLSGNSFNY